MARTLSLSGGEVALVKALGMGGSMVAGSALQTRLGELEDAELVELIQDMMAQDYVESNVSRIRDIDDVAGAGFRVNPTFNKELRGALRPGGAEPRDRRRSHRG